MRQNDKRGIGARQTIRFQQYRRIEPHIGFMRPDVMAEGQVGVQSIRCSGRQWRLSRISLNVPNAMPNAAGGSVARPSLERVSLRSIAQQLIERLRPGQCSMRMVEAPLQRLTRWRPSPSASTCVMA